MSPLLGQPRHLHSAKEQNVASDQLLLQSVHRCSDFSWHPSTNPESSGSPNFAAIANWDAAMAYPEFPVSAQAWACPLSAQARSFAALAPRHFSGVSARLAILSAASREPVQASERALAEQSAARLFSVLADPHAQRVAVVPVATTASTIRTHRAARATSVASAQYLFPPASVHVLEIISPVTKSPQSAQRAAPPTKSA